MGFKKIIISFLTVCSLVYNLSAQDKTPVFSWPEITNTVKPWARWWWMGNAVDSINLRSNLIELSKAGIGGVEITPIYGVKGEEENFIDYLSPKWMQMLEYTIKIADSLGMQVDIVLGTGWPYGGPQVSREYAATKLVVQKYKVSKNEKFEDRIIVDPEKEKEPAKLLYILAFGDNGKYENLTAKLGSDNFLKWKAKKTDYTIYAVFAGKTGQQVKRAAPGGHGFTVDHYSDEALNSYLKPFDTAFHKLNGNLRAIFNDSYEVYGTDFTPNFFNEFQNRRGYDLKPYIPWLVDKIDSEEANRVRSDYRETISDLLLENFDKPWTQWAHSKNVKSRLQAHGSPGNLIDLYASADIPECETFGSMPFDIPGLRREKDNIREGDADPVMLKFSSSAAHISGKRLTSSETFTWLRDHFKTALSQTKPEAEELLLNGVNHIFLHGSTYSPERAKWPGWKFYASVNFSPNNTIWEDAPALFSYVANCQSMLQAGDQDNETLLYWPTYDVWDGYHDGSLFFQFKIHSLNEWLHGTSFYKVAGKLIKTGYSVDFISDRFINGATVEDGKIKLPGGSYKSLVIPNCEKMPLNTLNQLIKLKKDGANIIFEGLPESVPGFDRYKEKNKQMELLIDHNQQILTPADDIYKALKKSGIHPETLAGSGLKYIRRDLDGDKIYFLVNHTAKTIDNYIPLAVASRGVVIYDPLTKAFGKAQIKSEGHVTKVKLKITPGQSLILKTGDTDEVKSWNYYEPAGNKYPIAGDWKVSFIKGGPKLPKDTTVQELGSWVLLGKDEEAFSGTATYKIQFEKPDFEASNWQLDLGEVRESAKVSINGKFIGTAWSVPFTLLTGDLKKGKNVLTIEVTNLAANRIRALELRGEEWKNFYEINMVDKDYKKFDATKWSPVPSGLLGPVTITPLR